MVCPTPLYFSPQQHNPKNQTLWLSSSPHYGREKGSEWSTALHQRKTSFVATRASPSHPIRKCFQNKNKNPSGTEACLTHPLWDPKQKPAAAATRTQTASSSIHSKGCPRPAWKTGVAESHLPSSTSPCSALNEIQLSVPNLIPWTSSAFALPSTAHLLQVWSSEPLSHSEKPTPSTSPHPHSA